MKPEISKIFAALVLCGMAAGAQAAGDVVIAVASTLTTTDPYDANDTLSQSVAKSFYQGLLGFDKSMKMVPVLAESYKASKDGLNYTFVLKKGIKFQDGTDFNAEAVKGAQALGLKVIPWTVNVPSDMERLIDWGVDGLISDYPDRLREVMRRRGMALPRG